MPEEVSCHVIHSFIHLILFIVCLQCTVALCLELNKMNRDICLWGVAGTLALIK